MSAAKLRVAIVTLVLSAACAGSLPGRAISGVTSASMSCDSGALDAIDRMLCKDPALSVLDRSLAYAFAAAFMSSSDSLAVDRDERAWLATRYACSTARCLSQVYRSRIDALTALAARERHPADAPFSAMPAPSAFPIVDSARARLITLAHDCVDHFAGYDSGDGRRSILALSCHHGNGTIGTYLFSPTADGSYRLILSDASTGAPQRQSVRSHGLDRLRIVAQTAPDKSLVHFYDYDGMRYRLVACGTLFVESGAHERYYSEPCHFRVNRAARTADAFGPSFSCAPHVPRSIERTICGDRVLSALDRSLTYAFTDAFVESRDSFAVERSEEAWLATTRFRADGRLSEVYTSKRRCVRRSYTSRAIASIISSRTMRATDAVRFWRCPALPALTTSSCTCSHPRAGTDIVSS